MGALADAIGGRKPDEDKSWLDTLGENIGNLKDQPAQFLQGAVNMGIHDIPETLKGVSQIPGTVLSGGLSKLGVDQSTADQYGNLAGTLNPIGAVNALSSVVHGEAPTSNVNTQALDASVDPRQRFNDWVPGVGKLEQGFETTASNVEQTGQSALSDVPGVGNLVPEAQNPYLQAYQQGHLASTVIPDAANIALVGDLAGGALGAASDRAAAGAARAAETGVEPTGLAAHAGTLQDLANLTDRGTGLANNIAGAPQNALTAPIRLPLRFARDADIASKAANGLDSPMWSPQRGPVQTVVDRSSIAQGIGNVLEPAGHFVNEQLSRNAFRGEAVTKTPGRLRGEDVAPVSEQIVGLSNAHPIEGQVAVGIQAGLLTPETVNAMAAREAGQQALHAPEMAPGGPPVAPVSPQDVPSTLPGNITPEILQTAQEHFSGTNPELSGRINEAAQNYADIQNQRTPLYAAGTGEHTTPRPELAPGVANPAHTQFLENRAPYLGQEPLENSIAKTIADPTESVNQGRISSQTGDEIRRLTEKADRWDIKTEDFPDKGTNPYRKQLDDIQDSLRDNPAFAPPDLRPGIQFRHDTIAGANDEIAQLRAAGHHEVADTIQSAIDEVAPTLREMTERGQIPDTSHVFAGQKPVESDLLGIGPKPSPLTKNVGSAKERTTGDINLDPGYQFQRWVKDMAERRANQTAQEMADKYGVSGHQLGEDRGEIVAKAKEMGLTPFDPDKLGSPLQASSVGVDTRFVPNQMLRALKDISKSDWEGTATMKGLAQTGVNKFNKAWKMSLLPLSPRWVIGHTMGDILMAASQKGVLSPSNLNAARKEFADPSGWQSEAVKGNGLEQTIGEVAGNLLPDGSLSSDVRNAVTQKSPDTFVDAVKAGSALKAAGKGLAAVPKASYNLVRWGSDFTKVALWTALKEDRAGTLAKVEELHSQGRLSDELYNDAKGHLPTDEQLVSTVGRVGGNYNNMSAFERHTIRNVFPFFSWTLHETRLAASLPFTNPYRVAWAINLGQMFGDPGQEQRPDFLKESIKVGDNRFLSIPWNIYGEGADSPYTSVQGVLRSTSPLIQWPAAAAGYNLGAGRMLRTAPDDRDQSKAGFIGFSNLGGYLGQQLPQTKLFGQLGEPNILRYDTGDPWLVHGRTVDQSSQNLGPVPAQLGQFLTGASLQEPDLADEARSSVKKERTLKRTAARYQTALARTSK